MYLSNASLGNIQSGFSEVVIGGTDTSLKVSVGEVGVAGTVTLNNNLVIQNSNLGGEVFINQDLLLTGSSSLVINGSGHTTTLSANSTTGGSQIYNDSVVIDGSAVGNTTHTVAIAAGTSGTGGIQVGGTAAHSLNGNGDVTDENLILRAAGDITFQGTVGNTDALESLTIEAVSVSGT